jgi:putative ABC transport system ATP-binding protein
MSEARLPDFTYRSADAAAAAVSIRGLNYTFDAETSAKQVLREIDFVLRRGEFVILTGPSGAGKTTLLTLIGALRAVQSGSLQVLGSELAGLSLKGQQQIRRKIGFIFQDHNLFNALTVFQTLSLAMELDSTPPSRSEAKDRALALLSRLDMKSYWHAKPRKLSTGQKQRVAIARALINNPSIILADEPTAALDAVTARLVMDLLKEHVETTGAAVLMVTHDTRAFSVADRIIDMVDGRITATR